MSQNKDLAFKIIADGHEYNIFRDGHVEGWEESKTVLISNCIPALQRESYIRGIEDERLDWRLNRAR